MVAKRAIIVFLLPIIALAYDWRQGAELGNARVSQPARWTTPSTGSYAMFPVQVPDGKHLALTITCWARVSRRVTDIGYAPTTAAFWCPTPISYSNPDLLADAGGHSGAGITLAGAFTVADFPFSGYTNVPETVAEKWPRGVYTIDGESENTCTLTLGGEDYTLPAGAWNFNAVPGAADGLVVSGTGHLRIGVSKTPCHEYYNVINGVTDGLTIRLEGTVSNEITFCSWRFECTPTGQVQRSTIARLYGDYNDTTVDKVLGYCENYDSRGDYRIGFAGLGKMYDPMVEIWDLRLFTRKLSSAEMQRVYADGQLEFLAREYEQWESVASLTSLTFEYVDSYPVTITIGGSNYGQPADPSKALVDAGDGVFVPWTSNTITLKGKQIRFRGDWRNSSGNFRDLYRSTFIGGHYVTMSGGFNFDGAPVTDMFRNTFIHCSDLTGSIPSGLFGAISGTPATFMFGQTFYGCSNLTGPIPSGLFGNISGTPANYMFANTFYGCSKLTGKSALMPDGRTHLYEQFPTASTTHSGGCYRNATGLDDYADIPTAWR